MDKQTLDIYSDLLFANPGLAASTRFSDALNGQVSHDNFSRFLNGGNYDGKTLWKNIKADVRTLDTKEKSVLSFDDTIVEKPYTKENPINCWHYAHDKGRTVKGINIISCLAVTSVNRRVPTPCVFLSISDRVLIREKGGQHGTGNFKKETEHFQDG